MVDDRHEVSVIIPTLGRPTLARCRAALEGQTRPADEIIVVVDDDRRGAAWARNAGLRQAKGDLIAFIDDDAIAPPDWLERLIRALARHAAVVAGGTYRETDPLLDAIRRRHPMPLDEQLDPGGLVGNAGNIIFVRTWLDACLAQDGYVFNPIFQWPGEDWELIWRLRKRGATMVYVPNPVVHLRRASLWDHGRHSFYRGAGIALLYRLLRSDPGSVIVQDSLLWGQDGRKCRPRWGKALGETLIGPFDLKAFVSTRHFWAYWIGEKCRAMGFLWGLACSHGMVGSRGLRRSVGHSAADAGRTI